MFRVLRALLPLVLVLLLVAAVVLVVTARPDLQDARNNVAKAWTPLEKQLDPRYISLAAVTEGLKDVPGPIHDLVGDTNTVLARWQRTGRAETSIASQVSTANELEALGRRLVGTAQQSQRVQSDAGKKAVVDQFAKAATPSAAAAYNEAIRKYEDTRTGPARRPIAAILNYDQIPAFDTGT